eukprot:Nitzschia sp. Nitz4//scaffold44_size153857//46463//47912//NITZ4_002710-RA/size153857-snap-gene-0.191-mRNA-1//1//CDS//3329552124//5879//frame0
MKSSTGSKSKDEIPLTLSEFDLRERGLFVDHEFLSKAGLSPHRFPESDRETEIAQQVLSEELAGLSLVEHEKVVFDVHGLPQASVDDPDNLQELLQLMEKEIQKISNKLAYDRAVYWDKEYVTSEAVRLRFLRGDFYNAKLAAHRMIFHFDLKKKLFGEGEILARDIRLSDLTKGDRDVLDLGFVQVLPTRDVAGRLVMVIVPTLARHCPPENHLRALWFFFSAVFNDDDNLRRGVVDLVLNIGKNVIKGTLESVREAMAVRAGIPKRIGCLHYCFDNPAMLPYATGLQLSVDAESRKRFRLHQGSYESIIFKLQTYGIPIQDYAMTADGTMSLEWHNEWLRQHERWEKENPLKPAILVPQRYDVLFGRGKGSREHTGNLRAGHMVAMLQAEYEAATKMEKTKIAERVVTLVKDSGGRFLKWGEGGWSEVDFMTAREKVSHFFRQLRTMSSTGSTSSK